MTPSEQSAQAESPEVSYRPPSRIELLAYAVMLVVVLLIVLGGLLVMSIDADTEPGWAPWLLGVGAGLVLVSSGSLLMAAHRRRAFLARCLRVAMTLEAHAGRDGDTQERSSQSQQLFRQGLELRDLLLASGDLHEADRLNAALPVSVRRTGLRHGVS
jgi:hypothetical protein